jgi:hypothetical protein
MGDTVHFGDDRDLVPPRYRNQIGKRYKSAHERGYVTRADIVYEFAEMLKAQGETLSREKLVRMLTALDRGYSINAKTLSFDMGYVRGEKLAGKFHFNSHRIEVVEKDGSTTPYDSLRKATEARGCSKEAGRKWLKLDGKPNRRGEVWRYVDSQQDRYTAPPPEMRKKGVPRPIPRWLQLRMLREKFLATLSDTES